jgi:hypothetical protein
MHVRLVMTCMTPMLSSFPVTTQLKSSIAHDLDMAQVNAAP